MAIFSLIYPFYLIQALFSRPPMASSLLSTPSPAGSGASSPTTPTGERFVAFSSKSGFADYSGTGNTSPIYRHIPIFLLARYTLAGARWFVDAATRQRGMRGVRSGKRPF